MGEIVFGKTIKLFRSVYVLSLLNRYAEQGLVMHPQSQDHISPQIRLLMK